MNLSVDMGQTVCAIALS